MNDDIKNFIELSLKENVEHKKPKSAGIIVVRRFDDGIRMLGLKLFGEYDIPKGKIEEGETYLEAALRETKEEASITSLNFEWGNSHTFSGKSVVFLASTEQDAKIQKNVETGVWEHHGASWLTFDEAEEKVFKTLKNAVKWARKIIKEYVHVDL